MSQNIEIINIAVRLIVKAAVLAAGFSGRARKRSFKRLAGMDIEEKHKELIFLRDKVSQLQTQVSILQKALKKQNNKKRYTIREKLFILCYMETFQIPRRRVTEHLGIARSTLYRWLKNIEEKVQAVVPANITPTELAALVWKITKSNAGWGRVRVANQLKLLGIFLSASTVRNILNRPEPRKPPRKASKPKKTEDETEARSIPAWYPNHVWSIDTTMVYQWGLLAVHVVVIIDHFSRKITAAVPLEGPNAGWVVNAMEDAIEKYGSPKHIISDQGSAFISEAFAECLKNNNHIKHRLGAIGKKGSIAVTERANLTLKSEWLNHVLIIRGIDHLHDLCNEFQVWYNSWRPHMALDGNRPDDVFFGNLQEAPKRDAKTVPDNIETRYFCQARITGYRLKEAG
ncbi:putative transposase OrfB [Limihaloglobus sulfuriphilus]|uniref:Putative transposase OrfB n=1 Tax=Limihaloglobus sulfuriphilus TaxID=1851148 RepID=A0A1Q2MCV0_9BACT|nr:DDE-type integrase/transposase/recombinase [Limihaloglobus sulfuriphilus]AQQ70500.1 putative transposase OrfB [Limihaloglobus sulfuriphilus]